MALTDRLMIGYVGFVVKQQTIVAQEGFATEDIGWRGVDELQFVNFATRGKSRTICTCGGDVQRGRNLS